MAVICCGKFIFVKTYVPSTRVEILDARANSEVYTTTLPLPMPTPSFPSYST